MNSAQATMRGTRMRSGIGWRAREGRRRKAGFRACSTGSRRVGAPLRHSFDPRRAGRARPSLLGAHRRCDRQRAISLFRESNRVILTLATFQSLPASGACRAPPAALSHIRECAPWPRSSNHQPAARRLAFDDVLLTPGYSTVLPGEADIRTPADPLDRAQPADPVGGHGHRHRGAARHRHGPGRRHRRHPPQPDAGRAGRGGPPGQEVRVRHGGQPGDHRPGRDARRRAGADGASTASPAFRWSPTARAPGRLVGILTNRDVRFASDPSQKVAELMTARATWSR